MTLWLLDADPGIFLPPSDFFVKNCGNRGFWKLPVLLRFVENLGLDVDFWSSFMYPTGESVKIRQDWHGF